MGMFNYGHYGPLRSIMVMFNYGHYGPLLNIMVMLQFSIIGNYKPTSRLTFSLKYFIQKYQ